MTTPFSSVLLYLLLLISTTAGAQDILQVGIVDSPPYCIKGTEGNWNGMTVELWRHLADKEQLRYEWVEYDNLEALKKGMTSGEITVAVPADLSAELTDSVRFLQHHYLTTLGVARPQTNTIWRTVRNFFSLQLLWIVLSLSALFIVIGTIIYFIERNDNEDQFGGERTTLQGIGGGFWWAGVTMTTIGYGDKAPVTLWGRVVAMLWMLMAMAISASLTAAVISAVDARESVDFPDDLTGVKVAVPDNSPAAQYLKDRDYKFTTFKGLEKSLEAIKEQEYDMVVGDVTALQYINNNTTNISTSITATNSAPVAYAIMVKEGTDLPERLDKQLVKFILSPTYRQIVKSYGGGK